VVGNEGRMFDSDVGRQGTSHKGQTLRWAAEMYVFGDLQISEDHFYINNRKTICEG
jgi:hypothetical protein